jgi:two-component system, chemotaxis family, chemotaxis protein CheY
MSQDAGDGRSSPRPVNILIVDDSATMRALIKRIAVLCQVPLGTVYEASNGREAIGVLESHDVQAMFTDINMPVMTGTELLREVHRRARWPHLLRVVISTDGSSALRDEVRDLNVELYVQKPFRPEVMRDVLSRVTEHAWSR